MSCVTNFYDKLMEMCCNIPASLISFPALLPHRPSPDDGHLFGSLCGGEQKNPSSVSLSTYLVEPVAVTVANTTSTQWKSVPCICFHSTLAPCFGQSLCSLLQLYEKSLLSYSMVNTLPYAAWRISNWEHMVQCSSPFLVFVVCFTCAD